MSDLTISMILNKYIDHLADADARAMRPVRSNLRRVLRLIDPDEPVDAFLIDMESRFDALSAATPPVPPSSLRAIRCHVRSGVRWAFDEGLMSVSAEMAAHLGIVAADEFAHWREEPKALTVYKVLVADMAVAGVSLGEIDEDYLARFLENLPEHIADWRNCWSAFTRRWRTLEHECVLPELDLPEPASNRPSNYAVRLSDLADGLQDQIRQVRARLEGTVLSERQGRPPLDASTRELVMGTLMRLLGFLKSERRANIEAITLTEALQLENARALLDFTGERYYSRMGLPPERDNAGRIVIGVYELGILRQLAAVVRLGLRDGQLHAEYAEEIRFAAVGARVRRENTKTPGHVDDYYRVAVALTERALANLNENAMTATQATLLRDAFIFALLAAHGYRRTVMAGIHLTENVRVSADGLVTICVPLEDTKPALRDMQLELPQEVRGLRRLYVEEARPALLCGNHTQSLLVAQGGGPLSGSAIYAVVVARSEEILGVRHNPHQARKALATDHGMWSNGDYLSVSAVLDSSPLTLQQHYADLQGEKRIARFDEATRGDWQRAKGGMKP